MRIAEKYGYHERDGGITRPFRVDFRQLDEEGLDIGPADGLEEKRAAAAYHGSPANRDNRR